MRLLGNGTVGLSASDVTDFLACDHLVARKLAVARAEGPTGRRRDDPHAELIERRAQEHELTQLERLSTLCGGHVDLTTETSPRDAKQLADAVAATASAMRAGAPLIYQATLFDGRWQGRVDFLRRIDLASDLGDYSYELLDAKLSRRVRPRVVHQLSLYSRLLALVQGVEPVTARVLLGDGHEFPVDLPRYAALHRRVVAQVEALANAPTPATSPDPVAHCGICDLEPECREWLVATDHLSLVAGIRQDQRKKLSMAGLGTLADLAAAADDIEVARLGAERVELLRSQAALQLASREQRRPTHRHLAPGRAQGYARLPEPDAGDLFLDLEGDPYASADGGVEYLWGWCEADGTYDCAWAHDRAGEQAALEHLVDTIVERRLMHPAMRVYHYAAHEASTLAGLALKYATREDEVDDLLYAGVLVDLYAVVRQAVQVGEESYSLKRIESHHGFERLERSVRDGGGSIVAYENWLSTGDDEILESIRAYNEDDCRSTLSLRNWLWNEMRPEAAARYRADFAELARPEPRQPRPEPRWLEEIEPIEAALTARLPVDPDEDGADAAERRLLAQLLRYHQREGKPQYWRYFSLRDMPAPDRLDEPDAIALLTRVATIPPRAVRRSFEYAFSYPDQEVRLKPGSVCDPATETTLRLVSASDNRAVVSRSRTSSEPTLTALIAPPPPDPTPLRRAIAEVSRAVLASEPRFAAVRSVIRREAPQLVAGLDGDDLDGLCAATLAVAEARSHLAIQGPPGTGKTFRAARMVVAVIAAGKRVAITAPSHAAIQNVLAAVEEHAAERGVALRGVYRDSNATYASPKGMIDAVADNDDAEGDHQLVAGTPWLLARTAFREAIDLLFIDEAGQFSLADLVATGVCAQGIVLLGDPQQLAQVRQAQHPGDAGNSSLEHLLTEHDTIPRERGVLLTETWRMHPDVCAFVSERSYEGLLHARDACALRRVDATVGSVRGAGLRTIPVHHTGCSQSSDEEADAIAAACSDLLSDGTVTSDDGSSRPLVPRDIMVVAPYNLAVRCIAGRVPEGVQVGTVDKFQGREAPVVFFAMTCSTGEDIPRGLDFLFSRNRLNVAISRAQCVAILVHSPTLLDATCRSLDAMELVDGVCRFVEIATPV